MTQIKSLKTVIKFKDTPIGKIPVDWEVRKLGDISVVKRGASPRPINDPKWFGGNVGWVRISDVTSAKKYLRKTKDYLSEEGVKNSVRIKKGEVILSICATIGRPIIVDMDACIHDGFVWFDGLEKDIDREYFYYFLERKETDLASKRQTGTQGNLNTSIISNIYLLIPPFPEQIKIAEILTTVDDAIEETDRIIEKTKELKKGLMQKLLTRGIGHKKFKKTAIGKIPEEWEVVKLMDITKINPEQIGNSYSRDYQIKYLDISGITQTGHIDEIKDITFEEAPSRARRVAQKNDILVSTVRPYLKAFARLKTCPNNLIVSTGYAVIRPKIPEDSEYIYQSILDDRFIKFLLPHMSGTNYPAVRPSDIGNYLCALPTENERKKIADILTTFDLEIDGEEANKQNLESLKKSLMQVLLTGRVRVKLH